MRRMATLGEPYIINYDNPLFRGVDRNACPELTASDIQLNPVAQAHVDRVRDTGHPIHYKAGEMVIVGKSILVGQSVMYRSDNPVEPRE